MHAKGLKFIDGKNSDILVHIEEKMKEQNKGNVSFI